jgi:hypothetical protein
MHPIIRAALESIGWTEPPVLLNVTSMDDYAIVIGGQDQEVGATSRLLVG